MPISRFEQSGVDQSRRSGEYFLRFPTEIVSRMIAQGRTLCGRRILIDRQSMIGGPNSTKGETRNLI
jgi:hypothetical protein